MSQTRQQFKAAIDDIIGDDSEVIDYVDYAFTPKFIKLANQKDKITPLCLDLISDSRATHSEIIISIMLMNNISTEKYMVFLESMFAFYKIGLINQYDLDTALFPHHPLVNVVVDHYKLPSERALLSKMIICHCLPENLSHELFDVLTGKAKRDSDTFYRECCTAYKFRFW